MTWRGTQKKCYQNYKGPIMYGVFRTLHDMFRRVHNMYPHTIIYFVSCTLDLCSPYVVSEMTNSKFVPKNPKFSKKSKKFQKNLNFPKKSHKSQNSTKKPNFGIFIFFGFILAFWEKFGFHVAYIGGTYRVQKSDSVKSDSVKGTEKAM
jgi:hypothetical protein